MPLPLTISCSSKSRLVLTFLVLPFWYLLTRVVPDKFQKGSKTVVCVCVCVCVSTANYSPLQHSQQMSAFVAKRDDVFHSRHLSVKPGNIRKYRQLSGKYQRKETCPEENLHAWGYFTPVFRRLLQALFCLFKVAAA